MDKEALKRQLKELQEKIGEDPIDKMIDFLSRLNWLDFGIAVLVAFAFTKIGQYGHWAVQMLCIVVFGLIMGKLDD